MKRILVLLFLLPPLASAALNAQQDALVGAWDLSYAVAARIENGEMTRIMGTAVLTVQRQQDSLIGELVVNPGPDIPRRPPSRFAAKAEPGSYAVFTSTSRATLNLNGEERQTTAISTWTLNVTADSLHGTVERRIEGMDMANQGPEPVNGKRRKT